MCSRRALFLGFLLILALLASGCLPLMAGSLGYEAYQYHKTGTLPGMPQQTQGSPSAEASPQASAPKPIY